MEDLVCHCCFGKRAPGEEEPRVPADSQQGDGDRTATARNDILWANKQEWKKILLQGPHMRGGTLSPDP